MGIPWLVCHNPEIDWRTEEVRITRCPEECGKQWRPEQRKLRWKKQKKKEAKEEARKKKEENEKKKKQKKGKIVEVKRAAEKWEIWDEEEKTKKMMSKKFYQWIKVFRKKQSERMLTRKMWDHVIKVKEEFVLRKRKVYLLSREEREEVREFIKEQL